MDKIRTLAIVAMAVVILGFFLRPTQNKTPKTTQKGHVSLHVYKPGAPRLDFVATPAAAQRILNQPGIIRGEISK